MRRRTREPTPPRPPAAGFHHHPFRQLGSEAHRPKPPARPPQPLQRPAPPVAADDGDLFQREMADVRPLSPAARARVAPPPPTSTPRAVTDPDAEALAELSDLVAGSGPFDLANSVEFVEGAAAGVDRRLVRRLRAGDFAYQSHLDLHGMSAEEARAAVDRFLNRAHQKGQRCVLIIHGRGLNSKDQVPVLKNRITTWLARGAWARLVLAFTSARPCDGGAGALYVLLRRQRAAKTPIHVTQGAKW
jgi:DNA-nicking Smr family endonuclease